jgi:hypothetical protein
MTIGLSPDQLFDVFNDALKQRYLEADAEILTAEVNLDPRAAAFMTAVKESIPEIPPKTVLRIKALLYAFMDTIVKNNEAIDISLHPKS